MAVGAPAASPFGLATADFVEPCTRAVMFSLANFLYDQAVFFAERLVAHLPDSDEALRMLAAAHLHSGDAARVRVLLQGGAARTPQLRYLLALSCMQLGKPEEAEAALLGRTGGIIGWSDGVAGCGPGLYLLGQARERLGRPEDAAECYAKCLDVCPFMWCAYERLSWLGTGTASAAEVSSSTSWAAPASHGTYFQEDDLRQDPVLHPCPQVAGSPRGLGGGGLCSGAVASPPRKRRRSSGGCPLRASPGLGDRGTPPALPRTPRAARAPRSPDRAPLSDRVSAALSPPPPAGQPAGARSPAPRSPPPSALRTPARLLSGLTPRRLLGRGPRWRSPPGRPPAALSPEASVGAASPDAGRPELQRGAEPHEPREAAAPAPRPAATLGALLRALGAVLRAQRRFARREALLEALAALPPQERSAALAQELAARGRFEAGEYAEAARLYAECLRAHKLHRSVGLDRYSTALWHLRSGAELGRLAQRALDWDRLRPQAWCVAGNCFSLQGEHDRAIRCFRRAIQVDPLFTYAYTLLAHEYTATEKFDKAVELYERALGVDRRHYNAWWGLGNVYLHQEEYGKARYHFQRAVDINGSNAVLLTSLGMACRSMGEPGRALELFAAAAGGPGGAALAAFEKGRALAALGRHEEALEELTRVHRVAPKEPAVHLQLGQVHGRLGDARQALLHFTTALDLCGSRDSRDYQAILAAQNELLQSAGGVACRDRPAASAGVVASA